MRCVSRRCGGRGVWWECLSEGMSKVPGSAGSAGAARLASRECVWWSEVKQGDARAKAPHRHTCHASHGKRTKTLTRDKTRRWFCCGLCAETHAPREDKAEGGAPARARRRGTGGPRDRPTPARGKGRTAHRFVRWCVCLIRIFGTKAEPQRIVATRPLCLVQHPVPHSSRLQGIHRVGPVTCDRVRLRPKLGVLAAERPTR